MILTERQKKQKKQTILINNQTHCLFLHFQTNITHSTPARPLVEFNARDTETILVRSQHNLTKHNTDRNFLFSSDLNTTHYYELCKLNKLFVLQMCVENDVPNTKKRSSAVVDYSDDDSSSEGSNNGDQIVSDEEIASSVISDKVRKNSKCKTFIFYFSVVKSQSSN